MVPRRHLVAATIEPGTGNVPRHAEHRVLTKAHRSVAARVRLGHRSYDLPHSADPGLDDRVHHLDRLPLPLCRDVMSHRVPLDR